MDEVITRQLDDHEIPGATVSVVGDGKVLLAKGYGQADIESKEPVVIRSLMDPTGRMYWSEFDRGGHFPAMEAPDLLVGDVREFFRRLR